MTDYPERVAVEQVASDLPGAIDYLRRFTPLSVSSRWDAEDERQIGIAMAAWAARALAAQSAHPDPQGGRKAHCPACEAGYERTQTGEHHPGYSGKRFYACRRSERWLAQHSATPIAHRPEREAISSVESLRDELLRRASVLVQLSNQFSKGQAVAFEDVAHMLARLTPPAPQPVDGEVARLFEAANYALGVLRDQTPVAYMGGPSSRDKVTARQQAIRRLAAALAHTTDDAQEPNP